MEPIILNTRCIPAALLAAVLAPIAESMAVTQVPMF